MPHFFYILFFFALGACVGSFLNVVVWRVPRGESLVSPPSRCPICLTRLAWFDNIPVFGWLALRGRCRYCKTPISAQYPTVEFITGTLFVLYYVLYFMSGHLGPCWAEVVRPAGEWASPWVRHYYLTNITEHWTQYLLAVFTASALLAASLIDAKLFWIPQSIPMLMAGFGFLYHTILDRPRVPGSLSIESGPSAALALGAGLGLVISLLLVWRGKMARSFAEGWPALEIDKEPAEEKQATGMARLVGRLIESYRRKLTPQEQANLARQQAAATARDKEEEDIRKAEEAAQPKPVLKEFSPADVRREIRKEMVFLFPPMLLGAAATALVLFAPAIGKPWEQFIRTHHWAGGFLGALLGGLIGGFVVWLTRILGTMAFGREAMGMGDVDLMFGVGAIIGAGASTVAFFVAPFFGLALAVYMLLIGKRRELPYGPYLSLGTAFVMIYYCPIADYLRPGLQTMGELLLQRVTGQ